MLLSRRSVVAGGAAGLAVTASPALAHLGEHMPIGPALRALVGDDPVAFSAGLDRIQHTGSPSFAAHLIFAMRYSGAPAELFDRALFVLTGEAISGWFDWMVWQEQNPQIVPDDSYVDFKREVLLQIDPAFEVFLDPPALDRDAAKIRFEEVTWGGVRKDGIPSLNDPTMVPAVEATYLRDDDLVFGVSIDGDARAFPLRILGWHEMANDTVGGVPVALAYCTLCGAGILFETARDGQDPLVFGTSGFLFRSNKLMYDDATHSLWNQFTGEPVIGPLVGSGIRLTQRPIATAPWGAWRRENPRTTVLSLQTGHVRDYGSGAAYRDYFASPDLMFPAATAREGLAPKARVFGMRTVGAAKAWPLSAFTDEPVINDRIGGTNVVIVSADGRTVRAYDRGERRFDDALRTGGAPWRATEDALLGPDGERAPRLPGHLAYWFAWNNYEGLRADLYEPE